MAYRIKPARDFTDETRRIISEQLLRAVAALEEQPGGLHEAIHEARKKFKRVRALYRLTAGNDKDFARQENARLRDMARSLSLVRDATALTETVTYLQAHAETPEEERALAAALTTLTERRDGVATGETDLTDKVAAALETCRAAIAAAEAQSFPESPRKTGRLLAKAWRKSLEKAKAALAGCHDSAHAEVFHSLRKSGQTYWMHLSLLRDLWPAAMRARQTEAKRLVDMLGHEHDLTLLIELLDLHPDMLGGSEDLSLVLGVIIRQQQALRHDALQLADTVFADDPEREADVIETLWLTTARG
ncbi:CHAD domain-containing protein [Rhizobium sp. CG5]|uniref:CHAD domain-containing protein n=1 Tax=Rhizobium sp. CG5 TaxID=2726076 RepID=UPI002034A692|nr:CHAD domain-containing protein [Rhizobium sp. CG5]MCM2475872.1 CHAD domain-containing protein [Rhizobium sp. CG5]